MGLIALDIDGTITLESRVIPPAIVEYLEKLYAEGWAIAFITGRTFNQCFHALERLPFAFYLAVQNGAILLSMPDGRILYQHCLTKDVLLKMPSDVVVYSGVHHDDISYYIPQAFDVDLTAYLARRRAGYGEMWIPLQSFAELPIYDFASTKSFGAMEPLIPISNRFEEDLGLQAPINKDPFCEGYFVMQTTLGSVTKGRAINDLRERSPFNSFVIAAGDDLNDIPLLRAADVKIAMTGSPPALLEMADIVAPPASEEGIIVGISQAINSMQR